MKFMKSDDAGRGAAELRRVGFLDDRVGEHRGAGRDAGDQAENIGRQDILRTIENPAETGEQDAARRR